jgi:hypothetical protein
VILRALDIATAPMRIVLGRDAGEATRLKPERLRPDLDCLGAGQPRYQPRVRERDRRDVGVDARARRTRCGSDRGQPGDRARWWSTSSRSGRHGGAGKRDSAKGASAARRRGRRADASIELMCDREKRIR